MIRQIPVQPIFSKVLGNILHTCLTNFFDEHPIISEKHYGCRKKMIPRGTNETKGTDH